MTSFEAQLIERCNAKDFQERLEQEVFKPLPDNPTVDQLNQIKLQAQDLFRKYYKENPCRGTLVPHRCVTPVYNEILDRLYAIEPLIVLPPPPPQPSRRGRTKSSPSPEDMVANLMRKLQRATEVSNDD
jgi:hypothetical protein